MVKVSICIPAYNNESSVRRLLASVEMQTFGNYEVIITDDSDGDEIKRLSEEKGYVHYYKNETRLGSTANWNAAIGKSSGEYIKIMHHDDWFTDKDSLQAFVDMLDTHPEAVLAFSGTVQSQRAAQLPGAVHLPAVQLRQESDVERYISDRDAAFIKKDWRNLFLGNTIGSPSAVIVRRSRIEDKDSGQALLYDENLKWLVDMEYYMRLLKDAPAFAYTKAPLVSIGLGKTQLTESCRDDGELNTVEYGYIFDKFQLGTGKKYRRKLMAVFMDAGKEYPAIEVHGISKTEYKMARMGKFFSKVKWKAEGLCAKAAPLFFYFCVTLEILLVIIDKSNYTNPLEGQLLRVTFLLAALKIVCTGYSLKEWTAMLLSGILGWISYRVTGRNEILRIVVFIAACKGVDMGKALKYVFCATAAGCLALVLLSVSGIYGGLYLEADFGRGYVQRRYCLGLGHPNALHCMFFMLTALGLYLYNERAKWYAYFILFLANAGMYALTDSNTGMAMTFCTVAGAAVIHYFKKLKNQKWVYLSGIFLFGLCVLFSVAAAAPRIAKPNIDEIKNPQRIFGNPVIQKAEEQLNGRIIDLYYGSENQEGTTATWSMFSRPENSYYFDMGFVRVFYWYGILPGAVYIILNVLLLWQCYRKRDGMGLVMLAAFSIYTVVEAHLVSVYIGRNYILFLMGMYMSDMLLLRGQKEYYVWGRKIR